MKKLLLALVALVAAMFSPAVMPASREVARLQRKLDEAKRQADAEKKAKATPADLESDAPASTRAVHEKLDEYAEAEREAEERSTEESSERSFGALRRAAILAAKFVRATGRPYIKGRAREYAATGMSEGIAYVAKKAGVDIKAEVEGEQTIPRQLEEAIVDLLKMFGTKDKDTGAYTFAVDKIEAAFIDGFDPKEISPAIEKFVKDMNTARLAYLDAKAAKEDADFGSRDAEEARVAETVRDQILAYAEFADKLAPYASKLKANQKRIFDAAQREYKRKVQARVRAETTAKAISATGEGFGRAAEWAGLPVELAAATGTEIARTVLVDGVNELVEMGIDWGSDALDELMDSLGLEDDYADSRPASRSAKGGSGISASTAKPALSAEAMLKAATAGKVVQIIDAVSPKSVDLTTAAGRTFVSDFRRAYKAGQCSFAGGRIVFNDGSYFFTA